MRHEDLEPAGGAGDGHSPLRVSRRAVLRGGLGAAGTGVLVIAGRGPLAAFSRSASAAQSTSTSGDVAVFPQPGARAASPGTEISFRGVSADALGEVTVVGSNSGGHSGLLVPHSDGLGVSYVPDGPFRAGEKVTVRAGVPLGGTADGSVTFTVARPVATQETPTSRDRDNPKRAPQAFRSRPDLLPPVIEVTTPAEGTAEGYIVVGTKPPDGQQGPMIFDDRGDLVWFAPLAVATDSVADVRVQSYQGEPVLTWWEGATPLTHGFGHFVIRDSAYQEVAAFQAGNGYPGADLHEFLLTPEGTALFVIYNPVRWDLSPVGGAANGRAIDGIVQELDIATGRVLFEWHSLDYVALDETYDEPPEEATQHFDYFHINSAGIDPDGNIIVCARHTSAVYTIDRRTGQVLWRLNGKRSDFAMGEGTEFAYQHDFRVLPSGEVTIFDNAARNSDAGKHSRGVVIELDMEAMTATLVREYIHPEGVFSASQGNVQMLPNGNAFVGWGSAPICSEFGPDGELRFDAHFPPGVASYRSYRALWTGQPNDAPAVVVEADADGAVTVYASWNGATDVASWQVLAGEDPDRLEPADATPRAGFETAMTVQSDASYFAVQALDGGGQVLGTSAAVGPDGVPA